jgi:ribosomal protein L12E/L44/L45/RPP1/RPP2
MDLPIVDPIEQAITRQVNHLVGEQDTNLNTILKMSMLRVTEDRVKTLLSTLSSNNLTEAAWYQRELGMTLDPSGNVIEAEEEIEAKEEESRDHSYSNDDKIDTGGVVPESGSGQ